MTTESSEPVSEDPQATPEAVECEASEREPTAEEHHEARILELSAQIGKVSVELSKVEAKRKSLKETYKGLVEQLGEIVESGPEELPLFDRTVGEPEAWRSLPLDALGLTGGVQTKLEDAGIETLGALTDAIDGERWWDAISGIGAGAAEKVAEAYVKFWQEHPEYVEQNCCDDRLDAPAGAAPSQIRVIKDIEFGPCQGDVLEVISIGHGEARVMFSLPGDEGDEFLLQAGEWEPVTA